MLRFWSVVFFILCSGYLSAQTNRMQDFYILNDSRIGKFSVHNPSLSVPEDFMEMLTRNREMIGDSLIPLPRKVVYQQRLIRFLETANNPELFAKGRYTDILRYNLFLIKWTEEKQLGENIFQYPLISIRSLLFFADEPEAILFLDSISVVYPDEVLRNTDAFIEKPYAANVISKVAYVAPESVKRYYTASGKLQSLLMSSPDPVLFAMRKIFAFGSVRTKAYFLLDPVFKEVCVAQYADSITTNRGNLFPLLTQLLTQQEVAGKFSINNELEYTAVEITRSLAMKKGGNTMSYAQISTYSKEQLFTLLVFGHKELFPIDVRFIENSLLRNSNNLSKNFVQNLPKQAVSDLVIKAQNEEKLEQLLKMVGSENRSYLLSLLSYLPVNAELKPENVEHLGIELPKQVVKPAAPSTVQPLANNRRDNVSVQPVQERKPSVATELLEPEEIIEPMRFEFSVTERRIMQLKQNIFKSLQHIPTFINEPYAKEVLLYATTKAPDEVFKRAEDIKSKFFFSEVLENAALEAPVSAKKYFANPNHLVTAMLSKSQNPYIKKMFEINDTTKFRTKPYLLINQLMDERMPIGEVLRIASNDQLLFKELVRLVARKKYVGRISIEKEFTYYALRFVRDINDKIGQAENVRFESLSTFTNDELYFVTVYGREEVFSTTFDGIFNRYEASLPVMNDKEFKRFLSLPKWRTFIAICAENNKLSRLLSHFTPVQKEELLRQFVADLDADNTFDETIMVSETIANIDDNDILLPIQRNIKEMYMRCDSAKNIRCMASYGILAALCKDKVVYDAKWFKTMAKKYQAAEITTLRFKAVDIRNVVVEQMYFYDDEDGLESYQSFITAFRNSSNWNVEEYFNYIKVSSTSGRRVEIYANKPAYAESGKQTIQRLFAENNYSPSVIIHRGHSFHTESTLEQIPESAKFVFIGSCGGFYKAALAVKNAPGAHIIATRQVGTKQINDPIIFAVNEAFREGKDIEWPLFWEKMRSALGGYALFHDYVPPHKNIESLFQHAYYKTLGL